MLRRSHTVTDAGLAEIGHKQPRSLSLLQCQGRAVTNNGLRELFRQCADSLQVRGPEFIVTRTTNEGYLRAMHGKIQGHGQMTFFNNMEMMEISIVILSVLECALISLATRTLVFNYCIVI